jgi:hypothetical protein
MAKVAMKSKSKKSIKLVKDDKPTKKTISFDEIVAKHETPSLAKIAEDKLVADFFRLIKEHNMRAEALAAVEIKLSQMD